MFAGIYFCGTFFADREKLRNNIVTEIRSRKNLVSHGRIVLIIRYTRLASSVVADVTVSLCFSRIRRQELQTWQSVRVSE